MNDALYRYVTRIVRHLAARTVTVHQVAWLSGRRQAARPDSALMHMRSCEKPV